MWCSPSAGTQRVDQLGGAVALEAVHALGAVELTAEVDPAAPVHLLEEDDREVGRAGGGQDALGERDAFAEPPGMISMPTSEAGTSSSAPFW